ncbi:MAG: prolipoprotein diacylglyceryl transferase family protein, partial [Bryocella sp.]
MSKERVMYPILQLGPFRFYTFGLMVGCAVCLGTWLVLRYLRTHNIPVNSPLLAAAVLTAGFAGAKLDNAFVVARHFLHGHPFESSIHQFFVGGYTYFGGLLAGLLAAALYVRLHRLPWLRFFDAIYCVGPAYAVGRVGCFLAGDGDYGLPSNL